MGKQFSNFNSYFNTLRKQIKKICIKYYRSTNNRIEYDDLFQEASLKLFEIYKEGKPLDINYSLEAVKNCLVNYMLKNINLGKIAKPKKIICPICENFHWYNYGTNSIDRNYCPHCDNYCDDFNVDKENPDIE